MQYRIALFALCRLSTICAQRMPERTDHEAASPEAAAGKDDANREIITRFMAAVRV